MPGTDLETLTRGYLEAFEARDLALCLEYFADDAILAWQTGMYRGKQAIEEWHNDRFAADLRLLRREGIRVEGNTVTIDAVATSERLKAWRIGSLGGRVTLLFQDGKIRDTRFTLRVTNPLEHWA